MRLPDFLQFTPDERRAALALLIMTGGGSLLLEVGKRHPEWMPDLLALHRAAPVETRGAPPADSATARTAIATMMPGASTGTPAADGGAPPHAGSSPGVESAGVAAADVSEGGPSSDPASAPASRHRRGGAPKPDGATPDHPVDVNAADATALMTLPGIGPALAARILADRSANGPFRTVEDLSRVKGIGNATLARLRPLVRTGGG